MIFIKSITIRSYRKLINSLCVNITTTLLVTIKCNHGVYIREKNKTQNIQ